MRIVLKKLVRELNKYDDDEWHTLWPVIEKSVPILNILHEKLVIE